ncbi:response regulator [Oculatella sp. FACHB-28]|uniref:response regulator n=1 Tax=Oculatella sp. FACHB-28 TaxID=2692845 RepID=UPI0016822E64|nr:response regulator [Oculatella sp. FACHB-28]MBD2056636.1 response regulator [Oculatella sp. FACHB-28]
MSSESYRILIVDDVADNLFLLQNFLESEGYTIDVASSGAIALDKMQASPPDLVLLDVMMPEVNGYELTRKIRRDPNLHALPVVLFTAHIESCRIKGLAVGASDFVRKPIDFEVLHDIIKTLLERKSARKPYDFSPPPNLF